LTKLKLDKGVPVDEKSDFQTKKPYNTGEIWIDGF